MKNALKKTKQGKPRKAKKKARCLKGNPYEPPLKPQGGGVKGRGSGGAVLCKRSTDYRRLRLL